jgi:hypothetical protein
MPKAPDAIFKQNVVILNQRMAEVARDIEAGKTADAAASLKAIGAAARWLSESLTSPKRPTAPPQMLPGQSCRPLIDPSRLKP